MLRQLALFAVLVLLLALMIAPAAFGQPVPTPTPPQSIVKKNKALGQPITFSLPSGKEMTLMINRNAPVQFPLHFEYGSTTCDRKVAVAPKCKIMAGLGAHRFRIEWTKHPDPSKLGKPVKYDYTRGTDPSKALRIEDVFLPSEFHRRHHAGDYRDMPRTEIVCNDYSWLGGTKEAPLEKRIANWSAEFMLQNPETGTNENVTIANVSDVVLRRTPTGTLAVDETGEWLSSVGGGLLRSFALLFASVVHIVELDPTGVGCSTAIKPNFTRFQNEAIRWIGTLPETYVPFVEGTDTLYNHNLEQNGSGLESFFRYAIDEGVFQ